MTAMTDIETDELLHAHARSFSLKVSPGAHACVKEAVSEWVGAPGGLRGACCHGAAREHERKCLAKGPGHAWARESGHHGLSGR